MKLTECAGGLIKTTDCYLELGMLCENAKCVEPWKYGSPVYPDCADDPRATPESLAAKAAHYDELARNLHVQPQHNIVNSVELKDGFTQKSATWKDVARFHVGENDGLWSSSYIASQAFRYGATRDPEALENLRNTVKGMARQFAITGVPGLVTREYITPGIGGMACPTDPKEYIPDVEKDDNRWLRIDENGCVNTYDGTNWVVTSHCVDKGFAGYCWLDNVSQDEYSGHMLGMGAIGKLVDDAEIKGVAASLAGQTAMHLKTHDMTFVDWDGRVTEHGKIYPSSFSDYPGFSASLAMSWMKVGAALSGDRSLETFYNVCLLKLTGKKNCLPYPFEDGRSYLEFLPEAVLYRSDDGCTNNYNNFNMIFMAIFNLLWYENRPEIRQNIQAVYEDTMMKSGPGVKRQMVTQKNSFFNFAYAAMKRLGPGSTGPALAEVGDAICSLREFPATKEALAHDNTTLPYDCKGRLGGDLTFDPVPTGDRCQGIFTWTADPYQMNRCGADPRQVQAPVDYLLAYWMGRYFGFITPGM
jgi:hypothetical protein